MAKIRIALLALAALFAAQAAHAITFQSQPADQLYTKNQRVNVTLPAATVTPTCTANANTYPLTPRSRANCPSPPPAA